MILPYPPSVNHYYARNRNGSVRIGAAGVAYRKEVALICRIERIKRLTGRLWVSIRVYPPDRRKRDLDNVLKALLDAMQHAGVYEDDSKIDHIDITREPALNGKLSVLVQLIPGT